MAEAESTAVFRTGAASESMPRATPLPQSFSADPLCDAGGPVGYRLTSRTLCVSGFPPGVQDADFRQVAARFGDLRALHSEGRTVGIVLISFFDVRHAEAASAALSTGAWPEAGAWLSVTAVPPPEHCPGFQNQGCLVLAGWPSAPARGTPCARTEALTGLLHSFGHVRALRPAPHAQGMAFVEYFDCRCAELALHSLSQSDDWGLQPEYASMPRAPPSGVDGGGHAEEAVPSAEHRRCASLHGGAPYAQAAAAAAAAAAARSPHWSALPPLSSWGSPQSPLAPLFAPLFAPALPLACPMSPSGAPGPPRHARTPSSGGRSSGGSSQDGPGSSGGPVEARFAFSAQEAATVEGRTTLCLRNIPNRYTRTTLLEDLVALVGDLSCLDFLYLPVDFARGSNLGYAFVNCTSAGATLTLHAQLDGRPWPRFRSLKLCLVCYAKQQGLPQLMQHFAAQRYPAEDDRALPVLVCKDPHTGQLSLQPMGTRVVPGWGKKPAQPDAAQQPDAQPAAAPEGPQAEAPENPPQQQQQPSPQPLTPTPGTAGAL